MNLLLPIALVAILASAGDSPSVHGDPKAEWEAWHAKRIERLLAADGWLALVARAPLKASVIRLGSAADADIRIDNVPAELGVLSRLGQGYSFMPKTSGITLHTGAALEHELALSIGNDGTPATQLRWGGVRMTVIERDGEFFLRVWDEKSPTRAAFTGIERYGYDPQARVEARVELYPQPQKFEVATVVGGSESYTSPGKLHFSYRGQDYAIDGFQADGGQLFVILADRTNREQTYGGGRFLYTPPISNGTVLIDLNRLYNPPCALSAFTTCPLPPPGNRLPVRIEAGEKRPPNSVGDA